MDFKEILELNNRSQLDNIASSALQWTPTIIWTTATPDTITVKAYYKIIGKIALIQVYISSPDGNGVSDVKISLPTAAIPKTKNLTPNISASVIFNGSGATRHAYIRDDGTNNDIAFTNFGTVADTQPLVVRMSGLYEIA